MISTLIFDPIFDPLLPSPSQVIIETPEGRPGPVQKLRVIPVGSNSLELNWDLPLMPNGVIRGYRVYFREVNGLILGQVRTTRNRG